MVHFGQQRGNTGGLGQWRIGVPLQVASHPVQPPNFSSPHPPRLGDGVVSFLLFVSVRGPNAKEGDLLPFDVSSKVHLVPDIGRGTPIAEKLSRSGEALANLVIRKRHTCD